MAKKETTKPSDGGSLTDELAESLNKKFSKEYSQVAYFLNGGGESPTDVTSWISTGCTPLDLAISNRPNGGLPVGKIVEITGLEQSGKSLLAAHVIASTQKQDGIAVYIDTESSLDAQFLTAIGVDVDKMLYIPLDTVEDAFEAMEDIIVKIREKQKDKLVTIIFDSVAAATTKIESAADYEKDGYATAKAIIMSKSMRKITNLIGKQKILCVFTNQLRQKLNAMPFGDQYTTSGGKALQFHASVRLRLKGVGKIKEKVNGIETVVGQEVECEVVKNRLGPPNRKVRYSIFYDSGIDDAYGTLKLLKEYKVVKQGGAYYSYTTTSGDSLSFLAREFKDLLESHPTAREELYGKLCDKYIMKYRHEKEENIDRDPEDIIVEDE
jgi:recombination protein RecA